MSKIITVGLDLAKNVFQVHGADEAGKPVVQAWCRAVELFNHGSQSEAPISARVLAKHNGSQWACPCCNALLFLSEQ